MAKPTSAFKSQQTRPVQTRLSRLVRLAIRIFLITAVLIGIAAWLIYSSAQKEPLFYQEALSVSDDVHKQQGDLFEKRILDLQNEARTQQDWQMEFTEDQINGWLASDFPEKFPDALPRGVSAPRLVIGEHEATIVFRFRSNRLSGIVQAKADVFCTDSKNQIGVQIKRVHCGVIPIPIDSIADRLTWSLRRLGMKVGWTELDSKPVALIDLPSDKIRLGDRKILIEAIELQDKTLFLVGQSVSDE